MMQRQQCKMQEFLCQASLFIGQLRLVPKVGQGVCYEHKIYINRYS
jgi:hypothetical protein